MRRRQLKDAPAGPEFWRVPRAWDGDTVAVLGGGPSLTLDQVDAVRAAGWRCVVINNSYLIAPWADLLYFCDSRWWGWHRERAEFKAWAGWIVTMDNTNLPAIDPRIRCVRNTGRHGVDLNPHSIRNGANSGYQVINILLHLGAARAVLLGYDMRHVGPRTHWHAGHEAKVPPGVFASLMIPEFNALPAALAKAGVTMDIINCTPGSALTAFPVRDLQDVIDEDSSNVDATMGHGARPSAAALSPRSV